MRAYLLLTGSVATLLLLAGCQPERDRTAEVQAMIQQEVDKRVDNYRQVVLQRCEDQMMEEAVRRTDSILLEEARNWKDTIAKPPKPLRPDRPALRPLLDTTPVRPLLPADTARNRN